eukprot:3536876-Alexandrium_andersonii.AAC.1
MGDQERHPAPRPPAPPEASHAREREPVPERGPSTRSDPNNFRNARPADQGRPGASAQGCRGQGGPTQAHGP